MIIFVIPREKTLVAPRIPCPATTKTIVNALSLYQFKTAAKPMHNKKITCPIWDMINKNRLPSLSDNDPSIGTKVIAHNVFTVVANVIIYCAQPAT